MGNGVSIRVDDGRQRLKGKDETRSGKKDAKAGTMQKGDVRLILVEFWKNKI